MSRSIIQVGDLTSRLRPQSTLALHAPDTWAKRRLFVADHWTSVNLGARFRQRQTADWTSTSSLGGDWKVGLGLCHGTAYGDATGDPASIVLSTDQDWTRAGNCWSCGWRLITSGPEGEVERATGAATLRVSRQNERLASAWYLRLTKTGARAVTASVFVPTLDDCPSEDDYITQVHRSNWSSSVNAHSSYVETEVSFGLPDDTLGTLDEFNMFAGMEEAPTSYLGGIDFLSVYAARLS